MSQGDLEKLDMVQFLRAMTLALFKAGVAAAAGTVRLAAGWVTTLAAGAAGIAGFDDKSESTRMLPKPSTAATSQALFSAVCHLSRAKTLSTRMMNTNTSSDMATPNTGIEAKNK